MLVEGCWKDLLFSSNMPEISSIVTSPAFNIGFKYSGYEDNKPEQSYLADMSLLAKGLYDKSSDNCCAFIQYDPNMKDPSLPYIAIEKFLERGWILKNQICWIKSGTVPNPEGGETSFGHYTPINSPDKLHSCWGTIFMLTKTNVNLDKLALGVPYKDPSNKKRWNNSKGLRCRGNMWFIPYQTKTKTEHPCEFPVKLVENCLKLQGLRQGIVFDPFAGSGTTGRAAVNLGLDYLLTEISKDYCDIIKKRLNL